MTWRLKRTAQCEHCPWQKNANPFDIPNGYDVEKHRALKGTIAQGIDLSAKELRIMACHETDEAHCVGWLSNQLGPGNNIPLRIQMMTCSNARNLRLRGEQHETFEETLPDRTL